MARVQIEIKGKMGDISLDAFMSTLSNSLWALRDLDRRFSEKAQSDVSWRLYGLRENNGGIVILEGKPLPSKHKELPRPDRSGEVVRTFTKGLTKITELKEAPESFSTDLMNHLYNIVVACQKDGCDGFSVRQLDNESSTVEITKNGAGRTITELVRLHHKAIGSVEGRIELVSIHKGYRKFNLYHAVTNRSIKCNLSPDIEIDVFKAAQERRRVVVSGTISYNIRGEPISVFVDKLRFLKLESDLPTIGQISGLDPNFTGNLAIEEYLRS